MAVMDYGSVICTQNSFIFESQQGMNWSNKTKRKAHTKLSLEEEISQLRKKMEKTVSQEHSLTSEVVIQVSCLLDEKINEYMKMFKKS